MNEQVNDFRKFVLSLNDYPELTTKQLSNTCILIIPNTSPCYRDSGFHRVEWLKFRLNKGFYPSVEVVDNWDPESLYTIKVCCKKDNKFSEILSDNIQKHLPPLEHGGGH